MTKFDSNPRSERPWVKGSVVECPSIELIMSPRFGMRSKETIEYISFKKSKVLAGRGTSMMDIRMVICSELIVLQS